MSYSVELEAGSMEMNEVEGLMDYFAVGYYMGGLVGASPRSMIESFTFNDGTSAVITATLASTTRIAADVNSPLKGYLMGGLYGGSTKTTIIQAIVFGTETAGQVSGVFLNTGRSEGTGINSRTKGYHMGGWNGPTNVIEDLNFSDETSDVITATMSASKAGGMGVSNVFDGYMMGGGTAAIENLIFSDESSQAITATLNTSKGNGVGVNSSTKGYCMGGSGYTDVIEDLNFSNEASVVITATMSDGYDYGAGMNSGLYGYHVGGSPSAGVAVDDIEGLLFVDESCQLVTTTLSEDKEQGNGVQYGFL